MINFDKRIFVTGASGFVGANLLHSLVALGASDVHVLVREKSNLDRIESILDKVTIHHFSLESKEETYEYIQKIKPQIVYHLAAAGTAVGRVPFTIDELIQSNTLGAIHLMDSLFEVGSCEVFVNTGSSSEYGQKDFPMKEKDFAEPNNLYGISKLGATQYATYIGKSKSFPIVTYRLFSVYGPREEFKRLIPTLMRNYLDGDIPQLSNPHSVRDFIYIDDVIQYFLYADIACQYPGDIFNIGSGKQYAISEVVEIIKQITFSDINPTYGQKLPNQNEPKSWVADVSKTRKILPHSPMSLHEGLTRMMDFSKNIGI